MPTTWPAMSRSGGFGSCSIRPCASSRGSPFSADGSERAELFAYLKDLPPPHRFAGFEVPPPILVLPNVFEPDLCKMLISLYEAGGGQETGNDARGRRQDRRSDRSFVQAAQGFPDRGPEAAQGQLQATVRRRIVPELLKIFSFKATRMERYRRRLLHG